MADFHHPKLRLLKGDELTHQELDNNINSFYYSSSLDGSNIKLYAGQTSGSFNGYTQSYDVNAFTASHAISASYVPTASYALFAISSSVEVTLEHSSSYAESASFADISNNAVTASHFANGVISASVNLNTLTLRKADNSTLSYLIHTGSGEANPDGLLSSSAQIASDISGSLSNSAISALNAGIVSASAQIRDRLVSAGAFTSASNASIRNTLGTNQFILSGSKPNVNTLRLHPAAGTNLDYEVGGEDTRLQAVLDITGSILNATSSYYNSSSVALNTVKLFNGASTHTLIIHTGSGEPLPDGLLSSSAQIASDISGSFNLASGSLASRITSNDSDILQNAVNIAAINAKTLISSSAQIAEDISGSGNVRFEAINSVTSSYYNSSSIAGDTIKLFTGTATHSIVIDDANQRDYISNIEIANGHDITFTGVGSAFDGTIAVTLVDSASHSEFADLAHVANSATTATTASHALKAESADLNYRSSSIDGDTIKLYTYLATHSIAIDDNNDNNYLTGLSLTANTGVLTATRNGLGNVTVDLPIGTNDDLTVKTITATSASFERLDTQIISSSVLYNSGSNIFGDHINDKHLFTGSIHVSGGLDLGGGNTRGNDITGAFWEGYKISASKVDLSGYVDTSGTPANDEYAKFTDANTVEGRSYAEVKGDLGLTTVISSSVFTSPSQGTVRAVINDVTTNVDTGLQTGDSPQFEDLYLEASGPTLYLRSNRTTVNNNTILGEIKFLTMDDSLSGTSNVGTIKVVSTSTYTGSNILTDDYKIEIIGNLDLDRIASGSWHGDVIASDKVTHRTVSVDTNGNGSANETLGQSETLMLKKGSNITLTESAGVVTIEAAGTAATDLSKTVSGTGFSVNSSTGDNVALSLADTNNWGLMSDEMFDKLDGIETSADVTDTTNVKANMPDGVPSGSASQARSQIGAGTGDGTVDTSGSPVDNDYAKFTDANTVEGRSYSEVRSDLGLGTIYSKDYTATVTNGSGDIPDGDAVYDHVTSRLSGYVDTSGTPVGQQIAIFTDANTISGSTNLKMHVNGGYPQFNGLQVGDGGTSNLYLGNAITPSSADKGARFHSNDADFYFDFQGDSTQNFYFRDYDGSGGIFNRFTFDFINSDFATDTGTFSGNVTANNFVTTSDRKLKKDLEPIKGGLDILKKFVSYEYELENKKDAGFIAQEVQESLPYAVHTKKDGYLALDTKPIIAHMHKAILEIDQRLSAIEEKLK